MRIGYPGGGGGLERGLTQFYTGRFRPEVQPITLLYTILDKKRYPISHMITHTLSPLFVSTRCWIPVSENRPWHCQVHRDAFSYGEVAPNIDTRLIVDLRWFGRVNPRYENYVEFSHTNRDTLGMPQPTFHFRMTEKEGDEVHKMMTDICKEATALSFLLGLEPSLSQTPGLALHITLSARLF